MSETQRQLFHLFEEMRPSPEKFLALHEPEFISREMEYVTDCVKTGWVSSVGSYVTQFENQLSEYLDNSQVSLTSSGTTALHTALTALGVGPGDEVLVPALTFVATANAVSHTGATPHFVDSEESTFGICPDKLRKHLIKTTKRQLDGTLLNTKTGQKIKALIAVHILGHPCQILKLCEVANEFNIPLIEDAAESLGSTYQNQHCGTFGKIAAMSFNGNKILTTGGGGALVTQDPELAKRLRALTTTAKQPHPYRFFMMKSLTIIV